MLSSIHIENVALIKNLEIDFNMNFSAFTGETGAGKSIIIDSIGFILGHKLGKEYIRHGEKKAEVTAVFSEIGEIAMSKLKTLDIEPDDDGCVYIRRSINIDGKSNAKIQNHPVPLSLLRDASAVLINIHGQHENQALLKNHLHLEILDRFAEDETEKAEYAASYRECLAIKKEISAINAGEKDKQRRIEMLKYQIEEIEKAKIKVGEEDKLTEKKKNLASYEKITKNTAHVYTALNEGGNNNAIGFITSAKAAMLNLCGLIDEAEKYCERLDEIKYELMEMAETVFSKCDFSDGDPEELIDKIETRLDEIYRIKLKYGSSEKEVLEYLEKCKKELSDIELSGFRLKELNALLKEKSSVLIKNANKLTEKRTEKARVLEENVENELKFLEMGGVEFIVDIQKSPAYSPNGADNVEFLVRANKGEAAMPLSKTASGGELSRLMLAIKSVIAEKDGVETMIYDEVDTGISGKTSRKIGLKLLQTSFNSQVLCVTHSAQIASLANTHYKVSKVVCDGRTQTGILVLEGNERIDEVARIIAGIDVTDSARNAAKELIFNKNADL